MRPWTLVLLATACTDPAKHRDPPVHTDVGDTVPEVVDTDVGTPTDTDVSVPDWGPGVTGTWPAQATAVGVARLVRFYDPGRDTANWVWSATFEAFAEPTALEDAFPAYTGCRLLYLLDSDLFRGATHALEAGTVTFEVGGHTLRTYVWDACDGDRPCTAISHVGDTGHAPELDPDLILAAPFGVTATGSGFPAFHLPAAGLMVDDPPPDVRFSWDPVTGDGHLPAMASAPGTRSLLRLRSEDVPGSELVCIGPAHLPLEVPAALADALGPRTARWNVSQTEERWQVHAVDDQTAVMLWGSDVARNYEL